MKLEAFQNLDECSNEALPLYLDGELSAAEENLFERHLAVCEKCRLDLNSQKNLLLVLNSAFESKAEIALPKDFTKIVVANAESSVSGLRTRKERSIAILFCCSAILLLILALGADTQRFFESVTVFAGRLGAIVSSAGSFIYDFTVGLVVLLRFLGSQMIFNSGFSMAAAIVLSVFGFLIFSRLMNRSTESQNERGEVI